MTSESQKKLVLLVLALKTQLFHHFSLIENNPRVFLKFIFNIKIHFNQSKKLKKPNKIKISISIFEI